MFSVRLKKISFGQRESLHRTCNYFKFSITRTCTVQTYMYMTMYVYMYDMYNYVIIITQITGDGPRRIVSLLNPPLPAQFQTTKEIQQMFLDEITSLLLSYPSNKLTLDKLSAKYYNTFNKQINFGQLGCTSLLEAVKSLPNVKV